MKKIIALLICFVFIFVGCNKGKKEQASKIEELKEKTQQLVTEEKLEEAIITIDELIQLEGESRGNLGDKYEILMKMEKYEDALNIALRREEVARRKSPWNLIAIIDAYLKLNNTDKALEYLTKAINERNFINLNYLKGENFASLQEKEEFLSLLDKIKENIGIGDNPKDFTIPLLGGEEFKLSAMKGKVVLIDFWAVWCPPCIKSIPLFKDLYAKYKDKEFEIISISLDEDEKKLKTYLKEQGMEWKISCSGKGWYDDTVKLYNVFSIPSTWLVDKHGKLRYFDLHGEELQKAIEELINEPIE